MKKQTTNKKHMKLDIIQLEEDDMVMVWHDIGNLTPDKVDEYMTKVLDGLIAVFGKDHVCVFPVRGCPNGETWDFTIIRKPKDIKS